MLKIEINKRNEIISKINNQKMGLSNNLLNIFKTLPKNLLNLIIEYVYFFNEEIWNYEFIFYKKLLDIELDININKSDLEYWDNFLPESEKKIIISNIKNLKKKQNIIKKEIKNKKRIYIMNIIN